MRTDLWLQDQALSLFPTPTPAGFSGGRAVAATGSPPTGASVHGPPCAPQGAPAGPRSPAAQQRGPRAPSWGRPGPPAARSPWACGPPRWAPPRRPRGAAAARPGPRSRWHRRCAAACGACAQQRGHRPPPRGACARPPGAAGRRPGPRPPRTPRSAPSRPGWCAGARRLRAPGRGPRARPGRERPPRAGVSPRCPVPPRSRSLRPPAAAWHTCGRGGLWG
uniref:Uncharacterized protein n=1 Tax=Canis lupus dingo TaxID=286419 RepID=A0A8C0KDW1_CANLU